MAAVGTLSLAFISVVGWVSRDLFEEDLRWGGILKKKPIFVKKAV